MRYHVDRSQICQHLSNGYDPVPLSMMATGYPNCSKKQRGRFSDRLQALSLLSDGTLQTTWQIYRPGHRLNLTRAGPGAGGVHVRVHDLTTRQWLTFDRQVHLTGEGDLGKPRGFTTTPIVVDLDGDRVNEVVLQNATDEILALECPTKPKQSPRTLWSVPGVAMNPQPGYTRNGALCPQAADVTGNGRAELLLAAEDDRGMASLVCVDGNGKYVWRR